MSARLRIDLGALTANYRVFQRAAAPGSAAAVVKADGYGLGAPQVGVALRQAGCRDFFVATAAEGVRLRSALPDARIFVFEGALDDTVAALTAAALVPVLNHLAQAELWRRAGGDRPCALHVDTGMHRLGFPPDTAAEAFAGLRPALLMTHLACADEPVHPLNRRQLEVFAAVRARLPGLPVSIGNSAATLSGPERAGDLARPGIGLYGGNPFLAAESPVAPVVTLEGRILQVRRVAAGESVGYGASYTARSAAEVAIVGLGYGDGLPRLLSNRGEAALAGRRCPIVGRVSMDLTAVDVTGLGAAPGDWVEFLGATVTVDEVAGWAETIPYEVLTGLGQRPLRRYQAA